jgi:hypothetical protein
MEGVRVLHQVSSEVPNQVGSNLTDTMTTVMRRDEYTITTDR